MQCAAPTLKIERPLYEEKNASIPHWLRRQINLFPAPPEPRAGGGRWCANSAT
eukprot:gene32061-38770_t